NQISPSPGRNSGPNLSGFGFRTLHEDHSVLGKAGERIFKIESIDVVERDEFDVLEFGMDPNVIFRDRQVVCCRQAFLFRSVLWVRLYVHTEYFAGNGRDNFVRRYRTVAAHGMPAHRERTRRSYVRIKWYRQSRFMLDADSEVHSRTVAAHVFD